MKAHNWTRVFGACVSSSYLMLAALYAPLAHASAESDAAEVFAAAVAGGFTFGGQRIVDDVSLSFMHFTKAGRACLVNEIERTGVIAQALGKKGALKAFAQGNKFISSRSVGKSGLDEYAIRGEMELQWSLCDGGSCVPAGPRNKVTATGVVVPVTAYGRPAFKVDCLSVSEAGK